MQGKKTLLLGTLYVLIASWLMFLSHFDLQVVIATCFFVAICTIDTLYSKIPNVANASLALAGLALSFSFAGGQGLTSSALGILLGFGLLFIPYCMGGFGAGDVKALMALGALVGPKAIFQIFLYMGLFGGVLAVLHYACRRNLAELIKGRWLAIKAFIITRDLVEFQSESKASVRFPYAISIALGYYAWHFRGDLL